MKHYCDTDKLIEWLKSENPKQRSIATCRFIISLVDKIKSGNFDEKESNSG